MFQYPLYLPPINQQPVDEIRPVWTECLQIAGDLVNSKFSLGNLAEGQAIHGLGVLACRQALAIDVLIKAGLSDQAPGVCRSLYEALVNLAFVVGVGRSSTDTDRKAMAEKFVDFGAVINRKYLDQMRLLKNSKHQEAVKLGTDFETRYQAEIEGDYSKYLTKYGVDKGPSYWNKKRPTEAACEKDLELRHLYTWCCNFSHSNVYACRVLLRPENSNLIFSPTDIEQPVLWASMFFLPNVLGLYFGSFDGGQEGQQRVLQLVTAVRAA